MGYARGPFTVLYPLGNPRGPVNNLSWNELLQILVG